MRARLEGPAFADAVGWAARAVHPRPHVPELGAVLLGAAGDRLMVSAGDGTTSCSVSVEAAVGEAGEAVLPGAALAGLVGGLPADAVELVGAGNELVLRCGRAKWALRTMEYGPVPVPPLDGPVVPTAALADAASVAGGAGARAGLAVVWLHPGHVVASDSYRMAVRRVDHGLDEPVALPPGAARLAARAGEAAMVARDGGEVVLTVGDRVVRSLPLEYAPFNWGSLLPKDHDGRFECGSAALLEAVGMATATGAELVRLRLDGGDLLVSAATDLSEASARVAADFEGDPPDVAFNARWLSEALRLDGGATCQLEHQGGLKPAIVREAGSDDHLHLLMPVRT